MKETFRDAFMRRFAQSGMNLKELAEAAGVSYHQLDKLKQRPDATTNVDDAMKVARFFGMSLEEFMGDDELSDRIELLRLWSALTAEEQAILRAAAKGLSDKDRQAKT